MNLPNNDGERRELAEKVRVACIEAAKGWF